MRIQKRTCQLLAVKMFLFSVQPEEGQVFVAELPPDATPRCPPSFSSTVKEAMQSITLPSVSPASPDFEFRGDKS